jgi:flagellar export protein FliJ
VPPFRFRLQPVLEHRRRIEEERQRAVAAQERERLRLEEAIRGHARLLTRTHAGQRLLLTSPATDMQQVRRQAAAAAAVARDARRDAITLAGVLSRLAAARQELMKAVTARKAIERLRERRYEAWAAASARAEAGALDEIAVMRAARARDLTESDA